MMRVWPRRLRTRFTYLGRCLQGQTGREVPLTTGEDFFESLVERFEYSWPDLAFIVLSFPHNPTTTCVDLSFMQRLVDFAREREVVLVHDFAYADLGFDGYQPPSIMQAEGRKKLQLSFTVSRNHFLWQVGDLRFVWGIAK
ncbi:MAG: hypothetical protein Ct9H300mP26_4800 [Acidimicrobiales bacterium]|nr:MAG: hypothetical protein Ct9H300mP26_4800 [Acidimicrobiales bacterium]